MLLASARKLQVQCLAIRRRQWFEQVLAPCATVCGSSSRASASPAARDAQDRAAAILFAGNARDQSALAQAVGHPCHVGRTLRRGRAQLARMSYAVGLREQHHQRAIFGLVEAVWPQRLLEQRRDLPAEHHQQSQYHRLGDRQLAAASRRCAHRRFDLGGALFQPARPRGVTCRTSRAVFYRSKFSCREISASCRCRAGSAAAWPSAR